jgi:hypothetical protein
VLMPPVRGATTGAGAEWVRGAGEAARFGCGVGADAAVASADGSGDSLGRGEGSGRQQRSSQHGSPSPGSPERVPWQRFPGSYDPLETAGAAPSKCVVTPAAAAGTSSAPNSIQNSDAPATVIKRARLISKSPPGRCYGRPRLDL